VISLDQGGRKYHRQRESKCEPLIEQEIPGIVEKPQRSYGARIK
jgi:hypothetical protein